MSGLTKADLDRKPKGEEDDYSGDEDETLKARNMVSLSLRLTGAFGYLLSFDVSSAWACPGVLVLTT